jgi:hypothetical protein
MKLTGNDKRTSLLHYRKERFFSRELHRNNALITVTAQSSVMAIDLAELLFGHLRIGQMLVRQKK